MAKAPGADSHDGTDVTDDEEQVPARTIYATYGVGLTANSVAMMLKVILPLWAIHLNFSATQIGIAVGMSALMPFLLSIHGGVLMDRFGTRRVTMVYAITTALLAPIYPALPFFAVVLFLQLITGLTANMGWVGAQTLIVHFTKGKTTLLSRFSIAGKVGTLVAPMAIGAMWDIAGPWGAFVFMGLFSWLVVLALWLVPVDHEPSGKGADNESSGRKLSDLTPKWSDYLHAFSLAAVPVVAFVITMSALRISSSVVQTSFYVVYLQEIGLIGTVIGFLIGLSEGAGLIGAFMAGFWERHIKPHWVFIIFAAISLFCVSITPALGDIFVLLVIFSIGRGYAQGLSQPVMFGILARAISKSEQGTSIGLRTTSNRFASVIVPVVMGVVVDSIGLQDSFYLIGGFLIFCCLIVALWVRTIPGFKT